MTALRWLPQPTIHIAHPHPAFVFPGFLYFPAVARSPSWFLLVVCAVGRAPGAREPQAASPVAGIDRAFLDWLGANSAAGAPDARPARRDARRDRRRRGRHAQTPAAPAAGIRVVLAFRGPVRTGGGRPRARARLAAVAARHRATPARRGVERPQAAARRAAGQQRGQRERSGSAAAVSKTCAATLRGWPTSPRSSKPPGARLLTLAAATGATNLPGDEGAPVRDLPLLFRCRERVVPAFTLELLVSGFAARALGGERRARVPRPAWRPPAPAH